MMNERELKFKKVKKKEFTRETLYWTKRERERENKNSRTKSSEYLPVYISTLSFSSKYHVLRITREVQEFIIQRFSSRRISCAGDRQRKNRFINFSSATNGCFTSSRKGESLDENVSLSLSTPVGSQVSRTLLRAVV